MIRIHNMASYALAATLALTVFVGGNVWLFLGK